jgi:hypothetical protein
MVRMFHTVGKIRRRGSGRSTLPAQEILLVLLVCKDHKVAAFEWRSGPGSEIGYCRIQMQNCTPVLLLVNY